MAERGPAWPLLVTAGAAAGVASGLFGIGGGLVLTPLLVGAFSFSQHEAHATSLAAMVPVAAAGAISFGLADDVDVAVAALLALGGIVGAPLGARLMARAPERPLRIAYATLMVVLAVILLAP